MVGNPNQLEDCQNFEALPDLENALSYSVTKGTSVPIISVDSITYAADATIDVTGEAYVELPNSCSSLLVTFGNNIGDAFELSINNDDPKEFSAGATLSIDDHLISNFTITSTQGSTWGYMAFVKPRKGLGFTVEA